MRIMEMRLGLVVRFLFLFTVSQIIFSGCYDGGWWFYTPGDTVEDVGYAPTQPIPYSHQLHAGKLQIPCQYCHSAARRSKSAGIPSVATCMGCHRVVATDKEHVKYVADKYAKKESIEWVKIHDLPDFVRFSHRPHVWAGVACQDCHGPVETMEVVAQVAPLQMGWCLSCHRQDPSAKLPSFAEERRDLMHKTEFLRSGAGAHESHDGPGPVVEWYNLDRLAEDMYFDMFGSKPIRGHGAGAEEHSASEPRIEKVASAFKLKPEPSFLQKRPKNKYRAPANCNACHY